MAFQPIALPAINTLIQIGTGASPEVYVTVASVSDITGPTMQGTVVDVTSMSTGNPWRQKVVTLLEGGEVSFNAFWQPMLQSHQNLLALFVARGANNVSGLPIDMRLVFPDQDGSAYLFQGFVSKCSLDEKVADVVKAAVTLTITGQVSGPGFA
jgi:Lambda phage tail tube protein, TTP